MVVGRVAAWVRARRTRGPFLVSAMGSHGGATAEGQREVIEGYGLTKATLGFELRSSMEVIELSRDDCPLPVFTDAEASRASATIVVNRVKPHTDFHGPYESGLVKMTAIGLGNRVQAELLHAHGTRGLRELTPRVADQVLAHGNVVLGVAIVENALEQTMAVEAVPAAKMLEAEPRLLELARAHLPRLPVDELDVLARRPHGQGHQRRGHGHQRDRADHDPRRARTRRRRGSDDRVSPPHRRPRTATRAGMGLADVITKAFADAIDHEVTRTNIITSGFLLRGKLPLVADDDRHAWELCLRGAGVVDPSAVRAMRIVDTLHCADAWVSDALLPEVRTTSASPSFAAGLHLHDEGGALRRSTRRDRILVAADDRTGALETAGACADAGLTAVVAVASSSEANETARCLVVDLASRHLRTGTLAAELAAAIETRTSGYAAHKIDSTLRGNWAHELVARQRAGNRRVLVIPAFPAVGRTCVGGLVFEDERRVERRCRRSRCEGARALESTGCASSCGRCGSDGRARGLRRRPRAGWEGGSRVRRGRCRHRRRPRTVGRARGTRILMSCLAGTAATIGAAAGAIAASEPRRRLTRPSVEGPVLVVCGSLHPAARAQVDAFVDGRRVSPCPPTKIPKRRWPRWRRPSRRARIRPPER